MKSASSFYWILLSFVMAAAACSDRYRYEPETAAKEFCNCMTNGFVSGVEQKEAYDSCTNIITGKYFYYEYFQKAAHGVIPYVKLVPSTADSARKFTLRFDVYLLNYCKAHNTVWDKERGKIKR